MLRFLQDQLFIQFLLIGAFVFILHSFFSKNTSDDQADNQIVLTQEVSDLLHRQTQAILSSININTSPDSDEYKQEFSRIKEKFIRDEIFFLEGLSMGLDKDDPIIKNRIVTKVEVLAAEQASMENFTEAELKNYYIENLSSFSWPRKLDLWQVFYSKQKRPETYEQDCYSSWEFVQATSEPNLESLAAGADPSRKFRMDMRFLDKPQLEQLYGSQAGNNIFNKANEGWLAPITTEEGCLLINVTMIRPEGKHAYEEVMGEIANRLEDERNQQAISNFYAQIKDRYSVVAENVVTENVVTENVVEEGIAAENVVTEK